MEEKTKHPFQGKLQGKLFRLCIILVIITACSFALVGIFQMITLISMMSEVEEKQTDVIKKNSESSMMTVAQDNLMRTAIQGAELSDDEFRILQHDIRQLASQTGDIFEHPDNYSEINVEQPKKENGGEYMLQLLISKEDDLNDQQSLTMIRKLANLGPIMAESLRDNENNAVDSYISLPSGLTLAMDKMSDRKFEEDGSIRLYDPTTRDWYKGAVRNKDIYFTPAIHSYFYDYTEVVYGMPVYHDGELCAVIEGSVKLDTIQQGISEIRLGESGFSILVSADGQLVASPRKTGELAMDHELSRDIRETDNPSIKKLLDAALDLETGFVEVTIDGEDYYAAYAPLDTLGWTQMMFVPKQDLEKSTDDLLNELDETSRSTLKTYDSSFQKSLLITIIVFLLLLAIAFAAALFFAKKLVTPINVMTGRIRDIEGDNMHFEVEDIYRTGDEIEILAEAFGDISDQLRTYIDEITHISAEKERMASEMNVARKIQSSMLPRIFPAFPERDEFDLFACMIPAKEVGGDFYDYFFLDQDHLAIIIGDVSGKGISSALFMVMTKHIIQSHIMLQGEKITEALSSINAMLLKDNAANMFVTVWIGILTISTGRISFVNAGHEYAALCRKGEKFTVEKDIHGPPVAVTPRAVFKENELILQPGDTLYLYTDGVTEAINTDEEMYGRERMLDTLNQDIERTPKELDEAVRANIEVFVGEADTFDDTTTLCIRYNGTREMKGEN